MTQATDLLTPSNPPSAPARSGWLLRGLFAALVLALALALALVLLLVSTVFLQVTDDTPRRGLARSQERAPVVAPVIAGATATPAEEDAARLWDGHGPLNVLLMGLDQDDCKYGPEQTNDATRTDTMVLVRLDPKTHQVAMLSIPRDLLVSIPDHGPGKINTAHVYGESGDYPGGGPGLLKEVIWENLGLQVHRFVRLDLVGFKHVLEIVGGLDMDLLPQPGDPTTALWDDEFPDGHCGVMTINFKPGPQHLTPDQAIQYARSRHSTSDFDRNRRQQEVLVALRARLLQPDMILKAPQLLKEGLETVTTDFSPREIASLALLAKDVDTDAIARLQLDDKVLVSDRLQPSGQYVLRLIPGAAEEVMRRFQAFQAPPTATPMPTPDPNATPLPRRRVVPTAEPTLEAPVATAEPPTAEPPPPEEDEDEDG